MIRDLLCNAFGVSVFYLIPTQGAPFARLRDDPGLRCETTSRLLRTLANA